VDTGIGDSGIFIGVRCRRVALGEYTILKEKVLSSTIESSVDKEDLKRFNCQSFQVFFPFINNTGLNK